MQSWFYSVLSQMNACLKGHPIWRSFGTEQEVIMFKKSVTEEEKNVLIKERERRERSSCLCIEALIRERERLGRSAQ